MGIFQEAAIIAGDIVTQPIRAKIIEYQTGKKQKVTKIVTEGALMGDGSINPNIKTPLDAAFEAIKTGKTVYVADIHVKKVTWKVEDIQ